MSAAVVTGAGRGIGREVARRLVARGLAVLVTDVDEASAQATRAEVGAAEAMALDVRDPAAHRAAAARAAGLGTLTVWVNNAGVLRTNKAWEHPDDDVRLMVEANLLGVMWGSRAAVEAMPGAGDVINLASMSSFAHAPGLAVYAATKHGVLGFTTGLQGDLHGAGRPIRMHAVCPDTVETGMVRERVADPESSIVFSAPTVLAPEQVAEAAVGLLDSDQLVLTLPRSRAAMLHAFAPFPRLALRVTPLFRRVGERERAKRLRAA